MNQRIEGGTFDQLYLEHLRNVFESVGDYLIDPSIVSNLVRKLRLISEGFECIARLGSMYKSLETLVADARLLATSQGYSSDVQLIHPVERDFSHHTGQKYGLFISTYEYDVYALKENAPRKIIDSQITEGTIVGLLRQ